MKNLPLRAVLVVFLLAVLDAAAQVPHLVNYQGRVAVGGTNFDGTGQFKFALVNADGTATYWSNDGTSVAGSQPVEAVALPVVKGLYSVQLGDVALANMAALPGGVFDHADVRLRVWFNDGTRGFELLAPDKRFAAVGYAIMAETVADGAVTAVKIAPGAIDSTHLAPGLILGGTTTGTFNGGLTGNVTGSAMNFSGSLAGDVIGTQGTTVVASVGGSTAANLHGAELTVNAAASANGVNALVKRDGSGGFSAGTITLVGGLGLPATTGAGVGMISQNGTALLQSFGTNNVFTGLGAGNFSLTGSGSTGIGQNALAGLTSGNNNIGLGFNAGNTLTTGSNNIAIGNTGLAGDSGIIRLGTGGIHTDTYLAGVVHGNGSGLTGITVAAADLTGTITGAQIAAGAVGSVHIAAGAVGTTQLAAGSVDSAQIATGAVGGTQLASGAVSSTHIAAGAVGTTQLATGSVGSAQIATGAVGGTQLAAGAVAASLAASGQTGVAAGGVVLSATDGNTALETAGYAKIGSALVAANVPTARFNSTAVWTGSEMIVWGGAFYSPSKSRIPLATGASYEVASSTWNSLPATGAPSARKSHSAVSAGSDMVVWSGTDKSDTLLWNGARYRPATKTWLAITDTNMPIARRGASVVSTGTEMIVWGGTMTVQPNSDLNTGARYNPTSDTWTAIATAGAPEARNAHFAFWTGTEMIVWGGSGSPNTGGRYRPATNTWIPMSNTDAPLMRTAFSAVWTGSEMIIWGGNAYGSLTNAGSRYNPTTDTWTAVQSSGAPSARSGPCVTWTGTEMVVWGGYTGAVYLSEEARYNPVTNSWTTSSSAGSPPARADALAVTSSSEMIIWGGRTVIGVDDTYLTDGGRYNLLTRTWIPIVNQREMFLYQKP